MQAARLHLPVGRDLRRVPVHLRLRAARRQPPAQRQERLVGGDGPTAGRRGRSRRRHPLATRGVGGLRPPVQLHRPSGGLPVLPPALAPGQDRRGVPQLRLHGVHRGPCVQPDVQDPRRSPGERGGSGLPAAGDRPGHVHQLRQRPPDHPQEAPVRDRPGGQVVPQRDHPPELRLPHPRVRADGDGVLRPAGRGRPLVPVLAGRADAVVHRPRHPRGAAPAAPSHHRRALALLGRHRRRGVPLPLGMGRARGHRQPHRLRPQGPRRGVRASGSSTSTRGRASGTSPT